MTKDTVADKQQLYADFIRLRPEHTSDAATHRALGIRYGLSQHTVRKYIGAMKRARVGASQDSQLSTRCRQLGNNEGDQHNPFPDKKQPVPRTFERVVGEIRRVQAYKASTNVSQDEAAWKPQPQYPALPIALAVLSDLHFGSLDVDYALLEAHLRLITGTPNVYVAFLGDMVDSFNAGHIPEGIWHDGVKPEDQNAAWADKLTALDRIDKLAALTWGNHDEFSSMSGINVFSAFFDKVRCPLFVDGGGVLNVTVGAQQYRLGLRHTHWGQSKLNLTNASKRMMQFWRPNLDAAFLGHVHYAAGEDYVFAGEQKIAVVCGTYKCDDGFRKRWVGDPQPGGFTLLMYPDRKLMQLCRYPDLAADIILGKIARLPKESEPDIIDAADRFRDDDESEVEDAA